MYRIQNRLKGLVLRPSPQSSRWSVSGGVFHFISGIDKVALYPGRASVHVDDNDVWRVLICLRATTLLTAAARVQEGQPHLMMAGVIELSLLARWFQPLGTATWIKADTTTSQFARDIATFSLTPVYAIASFMF
jgi:hypothetical protein